MFCMKCGKQYPDHASFCPFCGAQAYVPPSNNSKSTVEPVSAEPTVTPTPQALTQTPPAMPPSAPVSPAPAPAASTSVYVVPAPTSPPSHYVAPTSAPTVQKDLTKDQFFAQNWRSSIPRGLFIAYCIVATLLLIYRLDLFEFVDTIKKYLNFIGMADISSEEQLILFCISALAWAFLVYGAMMCTALWWILLDSNGKGHHPVKTTPYKMIIWAQYTMIIGYIICTLVTLILRSEAAEVLHTAKEEGYDIDRSVLSVYNFFIFSFIVLIAYHILGAISAKRLYECVNVSTPYGAGFFNVMATVSFISCIAIIIALNSSDLKMAMELLSYTSHGGSMKTLLILLLANNCLVGIILIILRIKQEPVCEYFENKNGNTTTDEKIKLQQQMKEYIPAWKRVQMEQEQNQK